MSNNNSVTIVPGRASSIATALRGHINAVLAYSRIGDEELTGEAIGQMRRDVTALEREIRLNMEAK